MVTYMLTAVAFTAIPVEVLLELTLLLLSDMLMILPYPAAVTSL